MPFRSVFVVLSGVKRMAVSDFGVVGCLFMLTGLRMFSGFSVMPGSMFVMFSSVLMVFVNCVVVHDRLPVHQKSTQGVLSGECPKVYSCFQLQREWPRCHDAQT